MTLALSGSSTGGIIFPLLAQQLQPKLGFAWTVRVMGFVMLFTVAVILLFARTRLQPRTTGAFFELVALKELLYTLFLAGKFLILWAVYIVYYYVSPSIFHVAFPDRSLQGFFSLLPSKVLQINSYATDIVHMSDSTSLELFYHQRPRRPRPGPPCHPCRSFPRPAEHLHSTLYHGRHTPILLDRR